MTLTFHPLDAVIYRTWLRLMLGIQWSTSAMRDADESYRRKPDAILRVASILRDALLPRIWSSPRHTVYRGLRLEDPNLHGCSLPPHPVYSTLPTLSFSERTEVAAYFADSGPLGMPAASMTGRPTLPDHGYVGTATIFADDVLFHWRYALAMPWLTCGSPDDLETIVWQRELVVRNHEGLHVQVEAFSAAAREYIASRYPSGEWIPPPTLTH
jgi:hypothetical protein